MGYRHPGGITLRAAAPDLFRGVVLVSSPYSQRPPIPPTAIWKANFKDKVFYWDYFREIGKADAEMARDPHLTMRSGLYSLLTLRPVMAG